MEKNLDITQYTFFKTLTYLPYVEEIWLYGSRARETNAERADIDLAIICPKATKFEWLMIKGITREADTLLHIDCVRFDQLDDTSTFKKNILNNYKVLFKRGVA